MTCVAALVANIVGAAAPAATGAASAPVHPGVQTFTGSSQCTANFIFRDAACPMYVPAHRVRRAPTAAGPPRSR